MIAEALKYPFKEDDWPRKMLFGSLLILSTILIVPIFTFIGYLLRVMRGDSMPDFSDLGAMTVEGLKASLVMLVYVGAPMTLVFVFETGVIAYTALLALVLAVYVMYSTFYQLSNKGLRAAFTAQVFRDAFSSSYLIAWLSAIVVSSIIGIVYAFSLLLIVTLILYPAVYFYQTVFAYRIMAEAIES